MSDKANSIRPPETRVSDQAEAPVVVDRSTFQAPFSRAKGDPDGK